MGLLPEILRQVREELAHFVTFVLADNPLLDAELGDAADLHVLVATAVGRAVRAVSGCLGNARLASYPGYTAVPTHPRRDRQGVLTICASVG